MQYYYPFSIVTNFPALFLAIFLSHCWPNWRTKMSRKIKQKFSNSVVIPTFVAKVQLFSFFKSREKAIRMTGRHWLAQRHFLLFTGRKLLLTQGRNCNGNCLYACCGNMLFAVKLTGIDLARLWVTGFGCIQGEWLLQQGVYGDTLTLQGKTVLSTGNIFAVWFTIFEPQPGLDKAI